MSGARACLITGAPGSGKTTVVMQAVAALGGRAGGFYTQELRAGAVRQGFKIVTLRGKEAVLAHVSIMGRHRVGKYGVDVDAVDSVGVAALEEAIVHRDLAVVDEIGKMELFSEAFKAAVWRALESGKPLLGTIMQAPHPWAERVKRYPGVTLLTVTRDSSQHVLAQVRTWVESHLRRADDSFSAT